jgi:hypothetical protein
MKAMLLATALTATSTASWAAYCTNPLDTRCPPSFWLGRQFDQPSYWAGAGPVARRSELIGCAQGRPSSYHSCQAAAAAERVYGSWAGH